jgi:hypothetical protein
VEVSSSGQSSACGAGFLFGQRWLVHADGVGRQMSSSSCSGNRLLAEGVAPVEASPAPDSGPPAAVLVALGVVAAAAGFSAWAFTRRRVAS